MNDLRDGPQAQTHLQRKDVLERIIADLHAIYGQKVLAIGLYGSMARQEDLPFSDIELFCIVEGTHIDHSEEWVYGLGKAEVNIYSYDRAMQRAQVVDDKWPLRQGKFLRAQQLYGEQHLLQDLRQLVLSVELQRFHATIAAMAVGEVYEWVGKVRNVQSNGYSYALPSLACHLAEHVALMLGLAHRFCYTTGVRMLEESLQLPELPDGYEALCQLVMSGQLSDSNVIIETCERLWQGINVWLGMHQIDLTSYTTWPFDPQSAG
jgi:kanamycin nucleotidyltransferase